MAPRAHHRCVAVYRPSCPTCVHLLLILLCAIGATRRLTPQFCTFSTTCRLIVWALSGGSRQLCSAMSMQRRPTKQNATIKNNCLHAHPPLPLYEHTALRPRRSKQKRIPNAFTPLVPPLSPANNAQGRLNGRTSAGFNTRHST